MQVRLRVMRGAHAGREIAVTVSEFLIGRGEECHLRPRSEAVSREHCRIKVEPNQVLITDLNSKNGTVVNGEPIEGTLVLQAGDEIHIGPLEFQLVVDHVLGGAKRPVVKDVKEAAARTAASASDDLDITKWLEEDPDTDISNAVATPETRQFRLEDTSSLALDTQVGSEDGEDAAVESDEVAEDGDENQSRWRKRKKESKKESKKEPGKLPRGAQMTAKDSREAASDMLKKFFNRR